MEKREVSAYLITNRIDMWEKTVKIAEILGKGREPYYDKVREKISRMRAVKAGEASPEGVCIYTDLPQRFGHLFKVSALFFLSLLFFSSPGSYANNVYEGYIGNVQGYIGIEINRRGEITYVHKISPAAVAGLSAGDVVLSVNGERLRETGDLDGAVGEVVLLLVREPSGEERVFSLSREEKGSIRDR